MEGLGLSRRPIADAQQHPSLTATARHPHPALPHNQCVWGCGRVALSSRFRRRAKPDEDLATKAPPDRTQPHREKGRASVPERGREGIWYRGGAGSPLENCSVQDYRPAVPGVNRIDLNSFSSMAGKRHGPDGPATGHRDFRAIAAAWALAVSLCSTPIPSWNSPHAQVRPARPRLRPLRRGARR